MFPNNYVITNALRDGKEGIIYEALDGRLNRPDGEDMTPDDIIKAFEDGRQEEILNEAKRAKRKMELRIRHWPVKIDEKTGLATFERFTP